MRYLEATVHQIGSELGTKGVPDRQHPEDQTGERGSGTIVVQIWILGSKHPSRRFPFLHIVVER